MRKLLPYEHQLIEALGITKEEYLAFVAIQQEYKDPKVGTALDIRCDPGTQAAVALTLTIVGTIFQVASALLFKPKPELVVVNVNNASRFFGFNSLKNLADMATL